MVNVVLTLTVDETNDVLNGLDCKIENDKARINALRDKVFNQANTQLNPVENEVSTDTVNEEYAEEGSYGTTNEAPAQENEMEIIEGEN